MEKLKSKIVPLLGEEIEMQTIERFSEELSKHLEYLGIVKEDPIIVPRHEIKKSLWQVLLNSLKFISLETHFLTIEDLGFYLEKNKDRFRNSYATFLPSNIRLYDDESQLNGRYIDDYTACYVYMGSSDIVATAIHEFGHSTGLKFDYSRRHPNIECVMKLPIRTRNFCESCKNFVKQSIERYSKTN